MGPGGNQDAIVVAQTGPSVLGMNLAKVIAARVFFPRQRNVAKEDDICKCARNACKDMKIQPDKIAFQKIGKRGRFELCDNR